MKKVSEMTLEEMRFEIARLHRYVWYQWIGGVSKTVYAVLETGNWSGRPPGSQIVDKPAPEAFLEPANVHCAAPAWGKDIGVTMGLLDEVKRYQIRKEDTGEISIFIYPTEDTHFSFYAVEATLGEAICRAYLEWKQAQPPVWVRVVTPFQRELIRWMVLNVDDTVVPNDEGNGEALLYNMIHRVLGDGREYHYEPDQDEEIKGLHLEFGQVE